MDLLELLRKRGVEGGVDFLREALRVLVPGIMARECRQRSVPSVGGASRFGPPTTLASAAGLRTLGWR